MTETEIYIVDTETTGADGADYNDKIVEIAICKLNTKTKAIKKIFEAIVGQKLSNSEKWAWIFQHSDLTPETVENGPPATQVINIVNKTLKGKLVTAFNTAFDFNLFLDKDPWNVPYKKLMPCIMLSAKDPCGIEQRYSHDYKWPSLQEAHSMLVNRQSKHNGISHRAMADSYQSAQVLLSLIESNNYNLDN